MNKWKEIWNKRDSETDTLDNIKNDIERTVLELKRLDGWDSTSEKIEFDAFKAQFDELKNELSWNGKLGESVNIESVFEVGCGAGPSLYMFEKFIPEIKYTGGLDYSGVLVEQAAHVLDKPAELYEAEAKDMKVDRKYNCIFANSVFSYFNSLDYAESVLNKMIQKTEYSIGILDLHDISKKEEFLQKRRELTPNYDERYKNLDKLFYPKDFFMDFADKNELDIKFVHSDMKGYWNNPFLFNVFMYKRS